MEIDKLVQRQRDFYRTGRTKDTAFRIASLQKLADKMCIRDSGKAHTEKTGYQSGNEGQQEGRYHHSCVNSGCSIRI